MKKKKVHPNSLKALEKTKWKKGQKSPNPKGAPRKLPDINKILADVLGDEKQGKTVAEKIVDNLAKQASTNSRNSIRAAEVLLNRGYGAPKETLDLRVKDGIKAVVTIIEKPSEPKE